MPQVCCCSMLLTSCVFVTFCVFKCAPLCPSLLFGSCYSSVVPRFFCLSPSCCFTFSTFFHFLFLCGICASIATKKEEKKKDANAKRKECIVLPTSLFSALRFFAHLSPLPPSQADSTCFPLFFGFARRRQRTTNAHRTSKEKLGSVLANMELEAEAVQLPHERNVLVYCNSAEPSFPRQANRMLSFSLPPNASVEEVRRLTADEFATAPANSHLQVLLHECSEYLTLTRGTFAVALAASGAVTSTLTLVYTTESRHGCFLALL